MAVLCAGLLFASCQKSRPDQLLKPSHPVNSLSTARVLNESETNELIASVEAFNQYAMDLKQNSATPAPSTLPADFTTEESVALVENTFNYYYARLLENSIPVVLDSVVIPMDFNQNGKLPVEAVGNAFNIARVAIYNRFEAITDAPEKQFTFADAEWDNSGSLKLRFIIDQPYLETEPDSFGVGDNWHFYTKGGKQGTTAFDGIKGAPEVLSSKVTYRVNGYLTPSFWIPASVQIFTAHGAYGGSAPFDPTNSISNSYAVTYNSIMNYWALFNYSGPYPGNVPVNKYIPYTALNYYLKRQTEMCLSVLSNTGKRFMSYKVYSDGSTPGNNISLIHNNKLWVANEIKIRQYFPPIPLPAPYPTF